MRTVQQLVWFKCVSGNTVGFDPGDGVTLYCNVNILNALLLSLTETLSLKNVFETDNCFKRAICTEFN